MMYSVNTYSIMLLSRLTESFYLCRKRRTSPSQEKPPGVNKRPRKPAESKHKEDEDISSPSDEDTPEPPPIRLFTSQTSVGSTHSGLSTTPYR